MRASRFPLLVLFACAGIWLAAVPPCHAESGQEEVRVGTIVPHPAVQSPLLPSPPATPACPPCERIGGHEEASEIPVGEDFDLARYIPTDPPSQPILPSTGGGVPPAPGDFTFYRNHTFTDDEMGPYHGFVMEPTLGVNGRAVMWAGNFYAAVSGDYGQTFSYINSADNFPADGVQDLAMDGPFCCDQIIYYDRKTGATFWLLLYHVNLDNDTNVQRIAVARTQADVLNNNWFWYDFTPASFGYPSAGYWLDFPDLAVSDNYLYHVTKMLDWQDPAMPNTRVVIARYPLAEMSQGLPMDYSYLVVNKHGIRPTQGATTTMYFAGHNSTTSMRIYRWAEGSGTVYHDDVSHGGFVEGSMTCPGPDGRSWCDWVDNWIWGAYVANGVLGFMVPSAQGGGYPYPHVRVFRFRESDRALLSSQSVWSENCAWLFPAVHPNDRGHLGGTIAFGGGDYYPGATAWIADDYNGGAIVPLENHVFASGNSGPEATRWGDYYTARRNVPYGNTWSGSGHCLDGGPQDRFAVGHYAWFGRERDAPPSQHTIHVDRANSTGYEDGSSAHPYNTVTEGHTACVPGDILSIQAGVYPENPTLSTEITVVQEGGVVTIGQ